MKKKKIVVMRSYIVSLSCLYLMICSSCGNPRSGESKNEDNTKEIEIVKKEPITYNFYVENSGSVKGLKEIQMMLVISLKSFTIE